MKTELFYLLLTAIQPVGHAFPARCPARAALDRVPLGPFPWLHRLRQQLPAFVRRLHSCRVGGGAH